MNQPLPSWHDTPSRQAILDFVARVSDAGDPDYVPPDARIAVFDNDGTLWCEKPMYVQLDYLLRKLAAQAEADPALRSKQPWQAAWEQDFAWLGGAMTKHYEGDDSDLHVLLAGVLALSDGQPVEEVEAAARAFVMAEQHPTLSRSYRTCIYQPMLELLRYLETHDFTCYIVSGGGRDFMRGFAEELYGIPRQRVIGSTVAYHFEATEEGGRVVQKPQLDVVDDGPAKPLQIWNVVGRRPILAAGNSNGDLEMLSFTGGPSGPALRLLVVHDDGEREFDYVAGAEKVIDAARTNDWITVSMSDDWSAVWPASA
ncbi:MAG: haloacid dehalogenase-like hydrolase [Caldilineaceae bacterium]|nr:haloacid dehalogenase-like hydrolase [Caldilineaceae bacterium]